MKKQWNKDIHDRLKDFPKKAPEGLLDDIKSEMLRRGLSVSPTATPSRQVGPTIIRRIASVAAIIAILFCISYLFQWKEPTVVSTGHQDMPLPVKDKPVPSPLEETERPAMPPTLPQLIAKAEKAIATHPDTLTVKEDTVSTQTTEKAPSEKRPETPSKRPQETSKGTEIEPQPARWAYTPKKTRKTSFDLGIYYSGIVAQGKPSNADDADLLVEHPNLIPGDRPSGTEETDSTSTASRAVSRSFSRNKSRETAKHHLPVRLGVSFRYYLNERWSIQSGLTYSYLASDLSYNSPDKSYQTKQKLHYIGIPLQIGTRIWESRQFKGYISAGAQVEKLISGKANTHYLLDKQTSGTLIENVSDKKLLFSALASIGAEYMLGKDLSLYAEPGIHYYFKNGNGLKTHYNEQPLNFNISIGFRFHWNK